MYFLFFPTALFFNSILANRIPKAFGSTFVFAPAHKADPSAKPKEPFFSSLFLVVQNY
jgi:hypothetical protein